MYNPPRYKSENLEEAFALMDYYPFATVISVENQSPVISHLPLTPQWRGDKIELVGHLARANPHSKILTRGPATVVFQGPHTFITSSWYAEDDVPTWNYSTVHASGQVKLLENFDELVECLKILTAHTERHWPSGWQFAIPEDLSGEILPKSIVGFKITLDHVDFKKKLSQNRSAADRAGVLKGLDSRADENSQLVLQDMLKLYSPNGALK